MLLKVNESRSKECGVTLYFPTGQNLPKKKYWEKVNIGKNYGNKYREKVNGDNNYWRKYWEKLSIDKTY